MTKLDETRRLPVSSITVAIIRGPKVQPVSFLNMRYFCVWLLGLSTCLAANFTHGQAARGVVGQPYFTAGLPGATQSLVGAASGLAYANNMLFVADSNRAGASPINNRV